jgi:EAL domain-containing protein (putative c-di-GMP-specific phosphodiesterase class I)
MIGPLTAVGTGLDGVEWDDLLAGDTVARVRLGPELDHHTVRLRHLGVVGDETWIELRSIEGSGDVVATGESDERAALRGDLRNAIARGDLTLHYQPIVPLRDGLERGYESLARWDHSTRGMIDAKEFLDLAEFSGLTVELGHELLRLACDDQRTWIADDDAFVSVNVSAGQLNDRDAAPSFMDRMRRRGVSTRQIAIEVPEAAFAEGPVVQRNLGVFRDAGVRIFLDDVGVHDPTLGDLDEVPVDGFKIDVSIIGPEVDEELVGRIVEIARRSRVRTVAVGVETSAQLDAVTRLGVDDAQGYLLGRPMRTPTSTTLP